MPKFLRKLMLPKMPLVVVEVDEDASQCYIMVREGVDPSLVQYIRTGEPDGGWDEGEGPDEPPEDYEEFECSMTFAV